MLQADLFVERVLSVYGVQELPITSQYVDQVKALPGLRGDPFDGMMVAQAMVEGMVLVTADRQLGEYAVPILLV